jgi:dTDP-4-dehydrorhamnose 3,5-epimerase-like enzyme
MNVTRSVLEDMKTKQLQQFGQSKGWRRETVKRSTEVAAIREKETRQTETYRAEGIGGTMGENGLQEEDWTDGSKWRKKIR